MVKSSESFKKQREMVGSVVSDKMQKTIVVLVERVYLHSRLDKVMRKNKKYKVHDERQEAREGDIVKIREGRPKSKTKCMYLLEIVHKASQALDESLKQDGAS